MAKPTGFIEYKRELPKTISPSERIKNYNEFYSPFGDNKMNEQAARCMDCGIPFCHKGCPLGNIIPDFNDMAFRQNWKGAYDILISTNNFPEFTGRVCPAPCEASCVLAIDYGATTIELIEKYIVEKAFELDIVEPQIPKFRTGRRVAVIGSGPAGLAAAQQLNKAGHWVVVFERDDKAGGLLRYGIPDFKLEKNIIDRRINIMKKAGIAFKMECNVGVDIEADFLVQDFDAIVLCGGSTVARTLDIPGKELNGVHLAMDFLTQQNRRVDGKIIKKSDEILATGKHVVVIGGGDTGSDCVGTSNRQNASTITQLELLPKPPDNRTENNPWPGWPNTLRTSTSHDEGCNRLWSVNTKEFISDEKGNLKALRIVEVEWDKPQKGKRPLFRELEETEREIPCDLALLSIGFAHPEHDTILAQFGIELDEKGNVETKNYQTNRPKVFAAGDMHRGQSLVVWAISEGREAAKAIDIYLSGKSNLGAKDQSKYNTLSFAPSE